MAVAWSACVGALWPSEVFCVWNLGQNGAALLGHKSYTVDSVDTPQSVLPGIPLSSTWKPLVDWTMWEAEGSCQADFRNVSAVIFAHGAKPLPETSPCKSTRIT